MDASWKRIGFSFLGFHGKTGGIRSRSLQAQWVRPPFYIRAAEIDEPPGYHGQSFYAMICGYYAKSN